MARRTIIQPEGSSGASPGDEWLGDGRMALARQQTKRTLRTIIHELVDRTNNDTARIRVLEQENDIIKSKSNSVEQNLKIQKKQIDKALSEMDSKIGKIDNRMLSVESTVKEIIKEMKKLATTANIKELESLVDIYSPLKSQFTTKEEVQRMIERRLPKSK